MAAPRKKATAEEPAGPVEEKMVPPSTERKDPEVKAKPAPVDKEQETVEPEDSVAAENQILKDELAALKAQQEQLIAIVKGLQATPDDEPEDNPNVMNHSKPHKKHRGQAGVWFEQNGRKFDAAGGFVKMLNEEEEQDDVEEAA